MNSKNMLYWHQVWKHMRKITNKEVEKRAVMELINCAEEQIDEILFQCIKELEKLNELRQTQGINKKKRVDRACVKCAIRTLYPEKYPPLSEKTGGKQKKKKKIEKHSPEMNVLTEVT